MSLFKKAVDKADDKKKTGTDKVVVAISDKGFYHNAARLVELNTEIDNLNAEAKMIGAEVREESIRQFNKLYEDDKKYPGSFKINTVIPGKKAVEYTFIPTDRYIMPDKDKQKELVELFGEDIIDTQTKYEMDSALVEQYGDVISELIEKSKKIPDNVKEKLIKATVKPVVRKGTINVLTEKYGKHGVEKMVAKISPVFMVKDIHIVE